MIDLTSLLGLAMSSLLRNKFRSLLTTLGIVIGVAAVILLVSIGNGLQQYVAGQFESLGSNTIFVMPFKATDSEGNFRGTGGPPSTTNKGFTERELRSVRRASETITGAIPIIEKLVEVSYGGETNAAFSVSSHANYPEVRSIKVGTGRFFSEAEEKRSRRVVALGYEMAQDLFGDVDPIGKSITVGSSSFKVVGVMAKVGGAGVGPNIDTMIYLPLSSAQKLFNADTFDFIAVKVGTAAEIPQTIKFIEKALSKNRAKDEFSVVDQSQILETITNVLNMLTTGIGGIAAISLVVGGIGIMNIMLVSVTERTREIGLRKAVGATPRVILLQFLIESVTLSLLGGMIGVGLGAGGSFLINKFFPAVVSPGSVVLAFGVSALVGIVFGILPARRAAKLSPISALRYE